MSIKKITDHELRALERLPNRFALAKQFRDLVDLIGKRYQTIEDVFYDLFEFRSLSNATGKQLDNAGQILNFPRRGGESDTIYRARLFSATAQLQKSGEIESIIEVFNVIFSPTSTIYKEFYPASFSLTGHLVDDDEDPEYDHFSYQSVRNFKAGGVDFYITISPDSGYFYFSDVSEVDANGDGPIDEEHGLGDESLLEGGMLSRTLYLSINVFEILSEDYENILTESGEEILGYAHY